MEENKNTTSPLEHHVQHPKNKKVIWIIIGLVVGIAAILGIVLLLVTDAPKEPRQNNNPQTSQTPSAFLEQYGQECKERDVTFTSAPMKKEELAYIRPLGAVGDGHVTPTDHVYIGGPNWRAADNTYTVLMPADGTIVEVGAMPAQYIGDRSGQQLAQEDHRIVISHSCRYFSIYIHVHKLGDKLAAAVGKLQPGENKRAGIELKAGETVGYIGGETFDWTPIDTTITLKGFITPSLYKGEPWKIHTVSPFDLYTGALRAELEAKSLRTTAPIGGKIDYDKPGKLVGNWFRTGTGGYSGSKEGDGRYWDGHLSIAPDYIDPSSTVVSIGNWEGSAQQFVVSGSVDPAAIGEKDGMVKYELKKLRYTSPQSQGGDGPMFTKGMRPAQDDAVVGTIALQVLAGEKLKLEKFPGKASSQVTGFTATAQTYER